jgi:hypothetical protein
MNLRHAAALALVGWYLMYPPTTPRPDHRNLTDAPLAEWKSGKSFDTAKECEAARLRVKKSAKELEDATVGDAVFHNLAENIASAQCIDSDDPRLKEK